MIRALALALLLATPLASGAASPGSAPPEAPAPPAPSEPLPPPDLTGSPPLADQARLEVLARGEDRTRRRALAVLGTWATANLAVGGVGWATADAPRTRAFHQGNALWNTVNLGIAGLGLLAPRPSAPFDRPALHRTSRNLDRALVVNAGLDLLYMAGGLVLQQVGKDRSDPRLQGWGDALLLQGGFLLTFDLGFLAAHLPWTRRLRPTGP